MRHGSVDLPDTKLNVLIPARVRGGTAGAVRQQCSSYCHRQPLAFRMQPDRFLNVRQFTSRRPVVRLPGGVSALFPCFLTLDAVPRPRNRFQPLRFYVTAARSALAETPLTYTF